MNPLRRPGLLLAMLTVATGCSSPQEPDPIPPLRYAPAETSVAVDFGASLRFEVSDLAGKPFPVEFEIPEDTVAHASSLVWRVDRIGEIRVLATARSGSSSRTHQWVVHAGTGGVDLAEAVRSAELHRVPQEGSLRLAWLSPPGEFGDPRLLRYEIALAFEAIPPDRFDEHLHTQLAHRRGSESYQLQLDGLEPGREVHVRIRAVDELERPGLVSQEMTAVPAAYFSLGGRVDFLDPSYDHPAPRPGARVLAQEEEVVTGAVGDYSFAELLDYMPIRIEVGEGPNVPGFYPISRLLQETEELPRDYLLIPVSEVQVLLPEPTSWEFLTLLRTLSYQSAETARVAHWLQYPVEVEVREQVLENGVDYGAALRLGIQKWNLAVGFEVLRESAGPPPVGAFTRYDLTPRGGGALGKVSLVEPADGSLYTTVPRRVRFELLNWFDLQELIDRVVLHELGHVLYLTHSPSMDHVMSAGVNLSSPDQVHPDEAAVLRALIHTPNGTRYVWYAQDH